MKRIQIGLIIVLNIFFISLMYNFSSHAVAVEKLTVYADEDVDGDGWSQPQDCDGSDGTTTATESGSWSRIKAFYRD